MTTFTHFTRVLFALVSLFVLLISNSSYECRAQAQRTTRLRGRVVDARTSEPIAKVKVISGTDESTITDENGGFVLENLPAGRIDLYITTVTFGLVKKTVTLKEGDDLDLQIALNEDAAAVTESVTVMSDPFESNTDGSISAHLLNKRELQQLSSVLVNDPIRAVQGLPGVTTNDDFRTEFSIRGAKFDRVGLYLDGVQTTNFVHTVAGGYPDTGSVSVINADTVDSLALISGGFPSQYGDRTAAILDIQTRDGNRVKPAARIQAALTGLSGVVDGPFTNKRGSYLFAARKSFVGYLVRRFNDEFHFTNNPPVIDVADFQGKTTYELSERNQIGLSVIGGNFLFDRNRDRNLLGSNQVFRGNTRNLFVQGQWSFTRDPHLFVQTRVFALRTTFKNINHNESTLGDGFHTEAGIRSDVTYQILQNRIQTGLYLRRLAVGTFSRQFDFFDGSSFIFADFRKTGTEQAYYAQDNWTSEKHRVSLTGGLRVEHSSITGETNLSPRGALAWSIDDRWRVHAAAGRYYQFPTNEQLFGFLGNRNLKSEHSTHFEAGIQRSIGARLRILVELYNREDGDLFFAFNEPTFFPVTDSRFHNSINGQARGVEISLQRRSANKHSGWISYAYGNSELTENRTSLTFPSDADQRHTINVYGNYRFTDTWNFSSQWRYGSGLPVPGFYRQDADGFFLTDQRNQTRIPYYSRLDVRLSKAFLFKKAKLTVTGEVLNLLNRHNLRYGGFDFFLSNGRVIGQLDRVLPILPSAAAVIEF